MQPTQLPSTLHQYIRLTLALMILLVFSACSTAPAPVDSRAQPPSTKIKTHVVGKGETLFSIAWAYGFDYKALARANGIDQTYTIHPGQVLKLTESAAPLPAAKPSATFKPSAKSGAPAIKPAPVEKPVIKKTVDSKVAWVWPAPGKVIQGFSESGTVNKGIDIAGKLGEAVTASASGRVVYAGSGLLGYGQLIIVKHNDQFLSAYAHNRILLVKEGDSVKGGQKIAEIGASGADKVKLHFEIRRDGKPVDPEEFLPRR